MMKKIVLPLLLALYLCGCTRETEEATSTSETPIVELQASETSDADAPEAEEPPEEELTNKLERDYIGVAYAFGSTTYNLKDARYVYQTDYETQKSQSITDTELASEPYAIGAFDFIYLPFSCGQSYNSKTHAYDDETMIFDEDFIRPEDTYHLIEVGKTYNGLTVTEIDNRLVWSSDGVMEPFSSHIKFDGEIEVTGFVAARLETGGYMSEGDIALLVNAESYMGIPIYSASIRDNGKANIWYEDFAWVTDVGGFIIGNLIEDVDENPELYSIIPRDGSFVPVIVTIKNIQHNHYGMSTAEIVEITLS